MSLARTQSQNIDVAQAQEIFELFVSGTVTFKSILRSFRLLCETLRLRPTQFPYFYPKLKSKLGSWRANAIWAKLDKRAAHRCYNRGKICAGQRVLIIGAGPCGLRTAIEAQLLGSKVIVIEKRDRFSRNNVLHLWPYNIADLRGLAAKKFYGKFCAGAIDHISIRQLQCILLKVCLLLGVEVFENTAFEELIEPADIETGWRARVTPKDHPVSQYEFDVLIGADGKRNTLHGFKRKEFRGKLAIAITVNFINRHTEQESMVEEISGVAFIFNQKFFNDLNEARGIDLENIVYYKDETHYFVMTAKKQSLLNKGVILVNEADTAKLLAPENINQEKLFSYAREAADFATNYQLPNLDFAVNHYGKPDVAMFDFTSMFQAENSSRIIERHGHRLMIALVGDSLLEPFWPLGTGCARGFFSGFDACWMMRSLSIGKLSPLEILAERESIYRILAQTTPENTSKDYASYTVDPSTRYPTLALRSVLPCQVMHLMDTDDPSQLEEIQKESQSTKRRRRDQSTHISPENLLNWLQRQLVGYENVSVKNMTTSFQNGMALCALIHHYRPDLVDFASLSPEDAVENNKLAFEILEQDLGVPPVMGTAELAKHPDKLTMTSYLSQIYQVFRNDIPSMKLETNGSDEELLDSQYRYNHHQGRRHQRQHEVNTKKLTIGQLVAGEGAKRSKKRRSRESNDDDDKDKENFNTAAVSKKRLNTTASTTTTTSVNPKIRSIKKEERYKIIEEQFQGGPKRRNSIDISKYREMKRPKELRRAIGKLDKEDWNVKLIEERIQKEIQDPENNNVNKAQVNKSDKVPKWSKAAFQDKFNIMKDKLDGGGSFSEKKSDIDSSLARLQKKLREGSTLETGQRGSNKVSALASELFSKAKNKNKSKQQKEEPPAPPPEPPKRANSFVLPVGKGGSENCHFCSKRVYVVERMSAEGKFFHRSCFRCDYCNTLLRLGSYVYKRDGPLGGKFFCIPHYTETYLVKYQYRRKADEIRDSEARRRELNHETISEWNRESSNDYLKSLTPAHKERLLSIDPERRGTTPERVEFEASVDQISEEEQPSIMDEDEWTDRNFGNSVLENQDDTSEDSVSDLDSDSANDDDTDEEDDEHDGSRPLTADEARQLQQEWIKRYDPGAANVQIEEEESEYDTVKQLQQKSSVESSEDSEDEDDDDDYDDESVNYEDGEYESLGDDDSYDSSEEDEDVLQQRLRASRPQKVSRKKSSPDSGSSTEVGSEDLSSEDDESFENSEFDRSESNTECEFTDSEGRPNPFIKELDAIPKRPVLPTATTSKITVVRPDQTAQVISLENSAEPSMSKYQYKTPNLSDRLHKQQQVDSVLTSNVSTRRALNLKKSWVTTDGTEIVGSGSSAAATATTTTITSAKKADSTEIDNRLKSLMDRLSSQQKLLKPANVEPSDQMKHILQASRNIGLSSSEAATAAAATAVKSPPLLSSYTRPSGFSSLYSVPPIYRSISTDISSSIKSPVSTTTTVNNNLSNNNENNNDKIVPNNDNVLSKSTGSLLEKKEVEKVPSAVASAPTSSASTTSSSSEESQSAHIDFGEETQESLEPVVATNEADTTFESCNDDEDVVAIEAVNDKVLVIEKPTKEKTPPQPPQQHQEEEQETHRPQEERETHRPQEERETHQPEEEQEIHQPEEEQEIQQSQEEEEEKVESQNKENEKPKKPKVSLSEDEITKIYKERNPIEKLARMNSYKMKQSSVIHDLIMSNRRETRRNSPARAPFSLTVNPLGKSPPPPPPTSDLPPETNIENMDFPLIDDDEDPKSSTQSSPIKTKVLPATPLTDPAKFGIPVKKQPPTTTTTTSPTRGAVVVAATSSLSNHGSSASNDLEYLDGISNSESLPNSPSKKSSSSNNKKTFMQSISGFFTKASPSRSRVTSPENPTNVNNNNSSFSPSEKFKLSKLITKSAPKAKMEDSEDPPPDPAHPASPSVSSSLAMQVSHPSTPPIPLSRKINITRDQPPKEDNLSETIDESCSEDSSAPKSTSGGGVPPEILEKLLRRGGAKTAKSARVAHLKRVRRAQEVQRQLEELDVQRKDLEERGIRAERALRGEEVRNEQDEADLMQHWFQLLAEKNALVRREQELLVTAKQLELEDRSSKLEMELREYLLLDSRSPESVVREGEVLKELLEISEQREKLQSMLERDKKRYQKEDKDIEAQMLAKGLRVTPVLRKISNSPTLTGLKE